MGAFKGVCLSEENKVSQNITGSSATGLCMRPVLHETEEVAWDF